MDKEEKKVYQRDLMRKRRASNKSNGESNQKLTESNNLTPSNTRDAVIEVDEKAWNLGILERLTAIETNNKTIWLAINGITERLDRLEAVQAKVVTLGVSIKAPHDRRTDSKFTEPLPKGKRMADNSPMGRMSRGEG
jgi:hypothetical protein